MQRKAFPRPFAGSYGVMLTVAILAIAPFIVVTTAAALYRDRIVSDLGANLTSLAIISGLANAGYAFGALLGGDLTQRFAQRKVFLACEADFIMAPVMLQVARLESGGHGLTQAGIRQAILITAMITGATTLLGILLYLGSAGARLPKPDLVSWLGHSRPAFDSPAFWAVLRRKGARE
jgi:hypothetical protein